MEFFKYFFALYLILNSYISVQGYKENLLREHGFPLDENPAKTNKIRRQIKNRNILGDEVEDHWSRLPKSLSPTNYKLDFHIVLDKNVGNFEQFTAPAKMWASVECLEETKNVTMHVHPILYKGINHTTISIKNKTTGNVLNLEGEHQYNEALNFYSFLLNESLIQGVNYEIYMDFTAEIARDRLDGLYLAQFQEPGSNETNYVAATQFAGTYARQVFPCWDEPNFKATFDLTIRHDKKYIALSNSEIINSTDIAEIPNWVEDTFNTTVKMSSYLLAFIVANYAYSNSSQTLPDGQPVRVYAPPSMINEKGGDYASNTSAEVMIFYENYLNMSYKMNKMDSAAVPNFYFGAMENWGLITYKEPFLIYIEDETTEVERHQISSIVAHESAHQWFGNLVTCKWWNNVWLNEGFATYFSYIGANHTHPEFKFIQWFLNDAVQYSMKFDANPSYTHPVLNDAQFPADVLRYYDRMSYEKAASLIRMMEFIVSSDTLKRALQKYLDLMQFKGAEQDDLFTIITREAHTDGTLPLDITIKQIMDTWTRQSSFPLIRVAIAQQNSIYISQERLINIEESSDPVLDPNELWYVPISKVVQDDDPKPTPTVDLWLNKDISLLKVDHDMSKWIMINQDGMGYFRVLYDEILRKKILEQLETDHLKISPLSRSQLIDDYFALAFLKYINIEQALELTKYLVNETDYNVWETTFTNLNTIYIQLIRTPGFYSMKKYFERSLLELISYLDPNFNTDEKGVIRIFRAQVLNWMCALDMDFCTNYSSTHLKNWMESLVNSIPIDVQSVVYCTGINKGSDPEYEFVFSKYKNETEREKQRGLYLVALGCSNDVGKITWMLEKVLEEESASVKNIRSKDKLNLVKKIASTSIGTTAVFKFLRSNFIGLKSIFGESGISEIVSSLSIYLNSEAEYIDMENFINENSEDLSDNIKESLKSSLERISKNIKWIADYYSSIKTYFENNY